MTPEDAASLATTGPLLAGIAGNLGTGPRAPTTVSRPVPRGSFITIYDCGAGEEGEPNHRDPCPMCGATVSGNDPVNGVCQIMAFIGRPIGDWITRGVK